MRFRKRVVKDSPNFCFACGKTLDTTEYVLDFGTSGSTFELCRSCSNKLHDQIGKVLVKDPAKQ